MALLDPTDPKVEMAVFGRQVADWLRTDIGNYLLSEARREEAEAVEDLINKKGSDEDCRARIWRARSFQEWLGNAIARGLQALAVLEEEQGSG